MWKLLLLVILAFWLGQTSKNGGSGSKGLQIQGLHGDRPWLVSPWNISTYAMGYQARRGFEIDPHPWDIANDPDYYRAVGKMKYGY